MEEILTIKEVAALLHSDTRTIERRARNKEYPEGICGKHGRYWLFDKAKLLQYIFTNS